MELACALFRWIRFFAEKFDARMVLQAITILVKDKRPIKLPQVPSAAALSAVGG